MRLIPIFKTQNQDFHNQSDPSDQSDKSGPSDKKSDNMKKILLTLLMAILSSSASYAQKYSVAGKVVDETSAGVPMATVQLLAVKDSSFVSGIATSLQGDFNLAKLKKGNYILKVSYVGYKNYYQNVELNNRNEVNVGTIKLTTDAVLLKEAVVTAQAAQVQVSGDSIVYNASAFRVPEGSTLEALVKKLPGADVDQDGKITINGKEVKKILVEGKEFFLNDPDVAMKNLPTTMIDKIKSYDRKSDLARVTGIDDGEEETVLDLTVKKGMNQGWFGNIDLGGGTKERYSTRLNINRFDDTYQMSLIGSMNNVNDMGFSGGGGRWFGGAQGLTTSKMAGFNFATTSDKLETGGNVRYNYRGTDNQNQSTTHNYVTATGAFSNSKSKSINSNHNVNADFRLEWKPDTMTNLIFRPSMNYSHSTSFSNSSSATFDNNPNEIVEDPLDEVQKSTDQMASDLLDIIVNVNNSRSQNYNDNRGANGELQFNRRIGNKGRNITFRATGSVNGSDSKQLSASEVRFRPGNEGMSYNTINNRYYNTPGRSHNYALQATYSEPIWKQAFLQFSYRFNYSYNKNDRQAYTYSSDAYEMLYEQLLMNRYNVEGIVDQMLSSGYNPLPNDSLSQFSEYRNYNQSIQVMLRIIRPNYNFNIGVEALPQRSTLNYKYMAKEYPEITRNVFNFTPTFDFRYRFTQQHQLRFNYRGRTSQPSMTNLLDITDDSNPLNISKGNPGLKPSFASNFRLFYNNYIVDRQQSYMANINFNTTRNSISNMVSYDQQTGVRTTQPMNINGNWSAGAFFNFNSALDHDHFFTINTNTNFNYSNNVSYLDPKQYTESKSKTKNTTIGERVSFNYRNDWVDIGLNGNVNYNHSENNVVKNNNTPDTWTFSYGVNTNITMPWGMSISTDINMNSRRGYQQASMNTNELIWNFQIAQSFLRSKLLTVSFQAYDILGKQSNVSRMVSATQSSDSRYNAINQYCMVHIIYRLNIFGNREARQGMGGFGGFGGGGGRGGRGGGGGGFGGGRGGGGGFGGGGFGGF